MGHTATSYVLAFSSLLAGASLAGCHAGSSPYSGPYEPHPPLPPETPSTLADAPRPVRPEAERSSAGPALDSGDYDYGRGAERSAPRGSALDPSPQPTRPGLATTWGETRRSRATSAFFDRADDHHPFALGKIFYNDPQGIRAMTSSLDRVDHGSLFPVGAGHVEVGIRDGGGRFVTGFTAGGRNYLPGLSGQRYTIFVRNNGPGRIEAVVSVDGLDVVDGRPASFDKRGYLIDPFGELEIEGFRTSTDAVAAFRFGAVEDSYAARKHGDTRNVGVIGVALFHERGDSPRFWPAPRLRHDDSALRHDADPFPQRFAAPPR